MKKMFNLIFLIATVIFISSCSKSSKGLTYDVVYDGYNINQNEEYLELKERPFIDTTTKNTLNISMDSSTAAYSNIRRLINQGIDIPSDAVNIEQMLNYFNYSYENTSSDELKIFTEIAKCPWNEENSLLQVAIKAKNFDIADKKPNNFVFLLDVSGSMYASNKLPLMIEAFKLLIDNLNDDDRISIVTYAGSDKILLDGGYGYEKTKISAIMSDLVAEGSTHGSAGITTAYNLIEKYYIEGGNNRVFLATDGDFNVGITSTNSLTKFISEKRSKGAYLSIFGFGDSNLKSNIIDTLAQNGNGNYYYIDSVLEAQKVFVSEIGGTLNTIAKDCKAQLEFNKDVVEKYRIIGYENKVMSDEEFNDSKKDAGEIGAGHTTICLVELKLKENLNNDIVKCTLRYKTPDLDINKEIIETCKEVVTNPSLDFIFASSVAEFGLILRNSSYKAAASLDAILERIDKDAFTSDIYKKEFCELVKKVKERN